MTREIHVYTLGQLQIQENGAVLEGFISVKAVLLFVYLAMHPGEHSRKKLAAMLWSETHDEQALKNLRTVLSSLRQLLPDALLVERDGLAINPDCRIQVDASEFEQGCETAFPTADSADKLNALERLAALYQGRFLADVGIREAASFGEWSAEVERRLHQLCVRLLYEIVRLAEELADYEKGIGFARRLVSLDPYWDAARRHLMRMLTYTNRANEALREYEAFAQLLADELAAEPEQETTALHEQIRTRNIRLPGQRETRSLIALPDMPFVESPDDIALVQRMLNTPQCRLLTIYGITGVGKTTLATQIAFHRQHLYRDGAHLVLLRQTQSGRDVAYQLAHTLNIEINSQPTLDDIETAIINTLKDQHLLLVLDNYEHLLPDVGLIERILEQTERVQILVTSQVPLNLFREWLLPLQGLRVPLANTPHAETFEAVRLFELTAQRINPRFSVAQNNLTDIVEICHLVDGLPLALIIAAGWTQFLPIKKIKEIIIEGQEFNLPVHQDLPPQHQSLDLMLDHTWRALSPTEQYALTAMSIFNTAFGIEEVQQVCALDLDVLMGMIQKALIQKFDEKYRMHPLIGRYARKKLLFSDQREALQRRYTTYVVSLLDDLQRQQLPLHEHLLALEYQYVLIWNYDWMPKPLQAHYLLAVSRFLVDYWEISRGDHVDELRRLFDALSREDLSPEDVMLVNLQLARFALFGNDYARAYTCLQLALRENAVSAPFADWAVAFNNCIPVAHFMSAGSGNAAVMESDEDSLIRGSVYHRLLALYLNMRDFDAAEGFLNHLLESLEHPLNRALVLATWGAVNAETGHHAAAYERITEGLRQIEPFDQPLLKRSLHLLATRLAEQQSRTASNTG